MSEFSRRTVLRAFAVAGGMLLGDTIARIPVRDQYENALIAEQERVAATVGESFQPDFIAATFVEGIPLLDAFLLPSHVAQTSEYREEFNTKYPILYGFPVKVHLERLSRLYRESFPLAGFVRTRHEFEGGNLTREVVAFYADGSFLSRQSPQNPQAIMSDMLTAVVTIPKGVPIVPVNADPNSLEGIWQEGSRICKVAVSNGGVIARVNQY